MKRYVYGLLSLILSSFVFVSCGGDETEDVTPSGSKESLVLRSSSLTEGSEVDASSTTVITLNYNALVTVSSSANITLNGQKVSAHSNSVTSMAIDIPVSLESGTSYTLSVPSGSIVAQNDASQTAPAYTLNFTTKKSGEQSLPSNDAMAVTAMLGFGWNLGNHFDSHNNGEKVPASWGSWWDKATPTEALYQKMAAAGVSTVRMPVTWGPWEGEAPTYTIESEYMELVAQNVFWARDAGLNVVLNTHHDEYWQDIYTASISADTNSAIEERIEATWKQIAEYFKNEGDYLIFESFNEIQDGGWGYGKNATDGGKQYAILNGWNQLVVNTIRATGGNNSTRWIAVPGYAAAPSFTMNYLTIPTDAAGKIIVAVHCYDPYNFTLAENLVPTWGTEGDKKAITDVLYQLKEKYIDQNIPCYLGEFGCSRHETDEENAYRAYYLEYFCRAAHFAGLSACIWDNFNPGGGSEHHAYFSHNDGSWMDNSESLVKMMINAVTSTDPSYTLESISKK
nr:Cel2 [uncultured bacterium]